MQPTGTIGLNRAMELGRELFEQAGGRPRIWERRWWDDRLMALTMRDQRTKNQLFRFVDALPALKSMGSVRRHLREYLNESTGRVPLALRLPLKLAPPGRLGDCMLEAFARYGARGMARRFIAGSTPDEVIETILQLRSKRLAFTVDLLGEAVLTEAEAEQYQVACLDLLHRLSETLQNQPEIPQIDRDDRGPIPRVNLSLKLTSLVPLFDALAAENTSAQVLTRLRPILRSARELGAYVHVDMEQYAHKELTLALFETVLREPEFRDWTDVGIVVQAYLRDAVGDLERLRDWARHRGTSVTIRLVKGAYWDYEVLHARQLGWREPVFLHKWETDANYERCVEFLLEHRHWLRPAFGSHNIRSLAHVIAAAEERGIPRDGYEIQMLYGMADSTAKALVNRGARVRVYTPYGALIPGMAYLVRRLLENTSNESFLRASSVGTVSIDELLRDPREVGAMWNRRRPGTVPAEGPNDQSVPPFRNHPPADFSRSENREAMLVALSRVRSQLGRFYPRHVPAGLNLGGPLEPTMTGLAPDPDHQIISRDPSNTSSVIGFVPRCTAEDAEAAVGEAREAFPVWARLTPRARSSVLFRTAALMKQRRFELAAWEILECGKPWREADADICEAIDFCEYYAREMIRLGEPEHRDVPGETNRIERIPRGVAVVIPPWNFPLAIPTGMTVAALVTGNTVVLKPAEQSPIIAWHLVAMLKEAGLPAGVIQYLPGRGEEVGQTLVNHPDVDLIAFTGSREVGLLINRQAAEVPPGQDHVKRVIAEMGGKNAIIIDEDADLDEAVVGVLQSAFGYAGQKCSACSRVIVLDPIYDAFLGRLVEAAKTLPIGPASDPATVIGPLIDNASVDRLRSFKKLARTEGRVVLDREVPELASVGHFVGPLIVADVRPESRLAQEEIFGPILCVLHARDLTEALRIAHLSPYALTGGLYSRSPAQIERVGRELRVGNLYINRPITGALVDRQPFGGFKLSGIGTKAGGADYLREFLLTRVVTENTLRRGFAPEENQEDGPEPVELTHARTYGN